MPNILQKFWAWYEKQYTLNTIFVATIFSWQLVHLYWLTTAVVIPRLGGSRLLTVSPTLELLLILVDYTEIPALISANILYLHVLQKKHDFKSLFFLILINSQWFHLFWITDEFIVEQFAVSSVGLPTWLALVAIFIDYLELPVIIDTIRRAFRSTFSFSKDLPVT
ncbi:MAG: hypothetical protein WEA04_01130 [Candidatus Andersenbacteria bacterium]